MSEVVAVPKVSTINQGAAGLAGATLTLLVVVMLQQAGIEVTAEQIAIVAPLLQSVTHWLLHKFNKQRSATA